MSETEDGNTNAGETTLRAFHGFQVPGISFESGHCIWLLDFTETPTEAGAYFECWLVTPEGKTTLFIDEPDAIPTMAEYHTFDDIVEAAIACELPDQETIRVAVDASDGTTIDLELYHELTPRARLLTALLHATPERIARSRPGAAIATATLNLLLPANGLRVAGRTDTGKRYRNEPDRVTVGIDARATLDGEDLGALAAPGRSIAFGDIHVPDRPIVTFGDLCLEYP